MRRTLSVLTTTLFAAGALAVAAPSPAQAASTDFGNACSAVGGEMGTTVYTAKGPTNPLPASAPQTGVITKARITLPAVPSTLPFTVKTLRPAGGANQYTVIAQSATINAGSGTQTYDVRVPVSAGDLLGTSGYAGLYCTTADAGDVVGSLNAVDAQPGSTNTYTPTTNRAIPVVATVEPDADKDGYGDHTQDKCPQSAATQAACPVAAIDSTATSTGSKISVLVTADVATKASVTGKVKVGGKNVKLKSKAKTVTPGKFTKITVKLPAALKAALADLPSSKSITVKLTVTAPNLVGAASTDKVKVKVPGTGR